MELLLLAEPIAEQTYRDLLARDRGNYVTTTFAKARGYIENHNDDPGKFFRSFLTHLIKNRKFLFKFLNVSNFKILK